MKIEKSRKELVCFELERAYDLAFSQEDDFTFFVNLMNYVGLFKEFPELHSFVDSYIVPLVQKDREPLVKGENKFEKYLNSKFDKLLKYLASNKIVDPEITKHVEDYKLHRDGSIISSNGKIPNMTFCLTRILFILWEKDGTLHRKHLGEYLSNTEGEYGNIRWAVFDERAKLEEIKVRYERHKLVSIGYYWDTIAFQYNLFNEYEEMSRQALEKRGMFEFWGIGEAYSDLMKSLELKEGKVEKPAYVEKHELKRALRQFHYHINKALDSNRFEANGKEHISFESGKLLKLGEKSISFNRGISQGHRAIVLEAVLNSKSGADVDMLTDNIWGESYEKAEPAQQKKYRTNIKNYVDGINTRLSKVGFPDFLQFDHTIVTMNTKYQQNSNSLRKA